MAVLHDGGGNDIYNIGLCGQGFAGFEGFGLLLDDSGNDRYLAGNREGDWNRNSGRFLSLSQGFSIGIRGFARIVERKQIRVTPDGIIARIKNLLWRSRRCDFFVIKDRIQDPVVAVLGANVADLSGFVPVLEDPPRLMAADTGGS